MHTPAKLPLSTNLNQLTWGLSAAVILLTHSATQGEEHASVVVDPVVTLAETRDHRLLGGNIALWYEPAQLQLLERSSQYKQWKPGIFRLPGGSWSDEIYWNGNGVRDGKKFDLSKRGPNGWKIDYSDWKPGFSVLKDGSLAPYHGAMDVLKLHQFAKANSKDAMVTVNAGMGTPEMAAEWVLWANKKMGFNVKYWEIGNELEGDWELGHIRPDGTKMDAKKYASIYLNFARAMKAVDPNIKIGGATSASDSIVFAEELIKQAGEHVDFISFHTYPVDARLSNAQDIFNEATRLAVATDKIRRWIKQYHPNRAGKIEIGITEWHVQVHENANTCNLLSGVWCTRFIGEMFRNHVDFANQWDTFSTTDHGGHGLFAANDLTKPRSAYWALWLWANHMGDTLVKSTTTGDPRIVSYATKDGDTLAVLLINQSATKTLKTTLNVGGQQLGKARAIELSHRSYLWNRFSQQPVWSLPPIERSLDLNQNNQIELPPMSATVVRLGETSTSPTASTDQPVAGILLPKIQPSDLSLDTYLVLQDPTTLKPYSGKAVDVTVKVQGPLKSSISTISTNQSAIPITLTPTDPGTAEIHLTVNGKTTVKTLQIKQIATQKKILYSFGSDAEVAQAKQHIPAFRNVEARRNESVYEVRMKNYQSVPKKDLALQINPLPENLEKHKIGGLTTKIKISPELSKLPADTMLHVILQSGGNHWMTIKKIPLSSLSQKWETLDITLTDPKQLEVMPQVYSIVFLVKSPRPISGSLYIDDLGFIMRNH